MSNMFSVCRRCSLHLLCLQVILPTCLRGFVQSVHRAILTMVYALRKLDGQVVCEFEATRILNVLPGSHILEKNLLPSVHKELAIGLCMVEGSIPACHINPLLHRFVHYPKLTAEKGLMRWLAMWTFERYNKKIKNLVKNKANPAASIANNVKLDMAVRFIVHAHDKGADPHLEMKRAHTCFCSGRCRFYTYTHPYP